MAAHVPTMLTMIVVSSLLMAASLAVVGWGRRRDGLGYWAQTAARLAVPAQSDNTIVISKGDYLFSSLVCGAQYASQKTVQKAIMVALGDAGTK